MKDTIGAHLAAATLAAARAEGWRQDARRARLANEPALAACAESLRAHEEAAASGHLFRAD